MDKKISTNKKVSSKKQVQQRLLKLQRQEKMDFKNHLDMLNDGVVAIILTVMVLEVPLPDHGHGYHDFLEAIFIFLVSFFVVGDFWYELNRILLMLKRTSKRIIMNDFIFLATLSVIPILTKWMMIEHSRVAVISFGVAYFLTNLMKFIISSNAWQELFKEIEGSPRMFSMRLGRRLLLILAMNFILILLAYLTPKWVLIAYLILTIYNFFYPERTAVDQQVQ